MTVNPQNCGEEAKPHCINPFLVLDPSGSGELSSEELNLIIENLIHRRGEDLESLAKESGRDLYANQLIPDRKKKLNAMVSISKLICTCFFVLLLVSTLLWLLSHLFVLFDNSL